MLRPVVAVALGCPFAIAACGGGDLLLPNQGQAARVTAVSGNAQTGTILEPAAESLVVRVVDRFGSPVPGVEVTWSAQNGGDVSPVTVVTGGDGRAATQRMLGAEVGSYGTTAVATPLPDSVVTFTTTAVAAKLVLTTQPGAIASSGAPIDPQPVLQLADPSGAPLARPGVSVTVQIASGDGTLHGTTSQASDASGRVAFTDLAIVGGPGARTLIFAADGYASAISTPVSLGVGAPASVAATAGDGQTVPVGTAVPIPPAVVVRDAGGTPVAGIPVVFAVASGGGSVSGANATTGADGVATVGGWTLGSVGTNTLMATVNAADVSGNPVTFTATALPGSADASKSSVDVSPKSIPASTGSSVSVVTVVVRDAGGNPIAGQTVTLSATGPGVSLTQPGATDASGTTQGQFSATASGDHAITAVTGGVTLGTKTVTVTPGPAVPSLTSTDVPGGTAGAETVVTLRLQDALGNPVPGAASLIAMTVAGTNAGASVRIEDAGGGSYRAKYTPTVVGSDQLDLRVAGQPVPGSPFTSVVVAGPSDPDHTTANVPSSAFSGVPVEILVQVRDAEGNPVGRGGDVVVVTPGSAPPIQAADQQDGTYLATWTPTVLKTENVNVAITLNGTPIAGSPFRVRVQR